jgi:hypothetical protein
VPGITTSPLTGCCATSRSQRCDDRRGRTGRSLPRGAVARLLQGRDRVAGDLERSRNAKEAPRRPLTREQRAGDAKVVIIEEFTSKQQALLDFVLTHYLRVGVAELDQSKLTPLLRLRYHNSISDLADFGKAEEIGKVFLGFQRYLYEEQIAS